VLLLLFAAGADAAVVADLLQGLQEIDINDYAIGLGATSKENVYVGAPDSTTFYPYVARLFPSDFDDGLLFSRAGAYGLRWMPNEKWEFGALGRIQTLGFDRGDSPELVAEPSREWTIEVGPTIAWRGPIRLDWTMFVDLLRSHRGAEHLLRLSLPRQYPQAFLIPEVGLHHYTGDFVDYYYGVRPSEFTSRPAYQGREANSVSLGVAWGVKIRSKWLLTGKFGVEYFASGISDSPIVDDDDRSSLSFQLTYDGDVFHAPSVLTAEPPRVAMMLGASRSEADERIDLGGDPGHDSLLHFDVDVRLGRLHHVGIGVVETAYDLPEQLNLAGDFEIRNVGLGYGFTLLRDHQKSLTVQAGVHFSELRFGRDAQETESLRPGPMLGAEAAAHFANKWSLGAKAQLLLLSGDRHSGRELFFAVGLQHQTFERVQLGFGYVFNRLSLTSGEVLAEPQYQGPSLLVTGSL
jgi:outer membrane protein